MIILPLSDHHCDHGDMRGVLLRQSCHAAGVRLPQPWRSVWGETLCSNDSSQEFPSGNSREILGLSFLGMVSQFPGISGKGQVVIVSQKS